MIYLSLLVCLALGQGTEGMCGRGTHNTTLLAMYKLTHTGTSPHKHWNHSNSHTLRSKMTTTILRKHNGYNSDSVNHAPQSLTPLHQQDQAVLSPLPSCLPPHQVLVLLRGGMYQTTAPPVLQLRC